MKMNRIKIVVFIILANIIMLQAQSTNKYSKIEIKPIPGLSKNFMRGMDVSMLKEIEEAGGKFYSSGKEMGGILKKHGINYIRLRLWNNPQNRGGGNCNLNTIKELAGRAKQLNMKVFLDFHYSDFWADPGQQEKPANIRGQTEVIRKIIKIVHNAPKNRGLGVFYCEGEWIPMQGAGWKTGAGNGWENQALFDFKGRALPSLDVFKEVLKKI